MAEQKRIERAVYVRDSIATVERLARAAFVKDSIATAERLALEAEMAEQKRIERAAYVRDSIATVERLARAAFVKDSIATAERLVLEAEMEEQARIKREAYVRDSIATVERIARAAFVKDSIANAEQFSEREALRIKREAEVEAERKRIAAEKSRQDSLALKEQKDLEALAEKHAESDKAWKSKLEAKPLDFETIILSLGNPDASVIEAQPEEVDKVIDILTPNPHAIVEIEGFYPKIGRSKVYDMYNSLLLANELKDALIDRGIDPKKLIVKGHGHRLSDENLSITDDKQRRILVRILNRNRSGYIPNLSSLFSLQAKESNYYQKYAQQVSGLTFKVEAIKLRRMLANEAIDVFDDIILEQKGNEKNFAYLFGTFTTMNEAISMVDKLKGHNLKQPKIYPYLNGIRVTDEQAKFMEDLYPELKNYLRYLDSE
jgi:outer membrane protein OmpA-like peptidoglycan-associated protein